METDNIVDFSGRDGISDALTDLLRIGAQQLLASAVEAELEGFLAQFADTRTAAGHAAVANPYLNLLGIEQGIPVFNMQLIPSNLRYLQL